MFPLARARSWVEAGSGSGRAQPACRHDGIRRGREWRLATDGEALGLPITGLAGLPVRLGAGQDGDDGSGARVSRVPRVARVGLDDHQLVVFPEIVDPDLVTELVTITAM